MTATARRWVSVLLGRIEEAKSELITEVGLAGNGRESAVLRAKAAAL